MLVRTLVLVVALLDRDLEFDLPRRIEPVGHQRIDWGDGVRSVHGSRLEPLLRSSLVVTDEDGRHHRSVPVIFTSRVAGEEVTSLLGTDPTGSLHVALDGQTADPLNGVRLQLSLEPSPPVFAADLLHVVAWWEALRPGRMLGLWMREQEVWGVGPEPIGHEPPQVARSYAEAVRKMARISQRCGEAIAMPAEIHAEDVEDIEVADQLVQGKVVRGHWRDAAINDDPQLLDHLLGSEHGVLLEFTAPCVAQIADATITLGEAEYRFTQVTVAGYDPGAGRIRLKPGRNNEFQLRLVTVPERTHPDGSTAWVPPAMTEAYRGRWVAQSGTKILRSGSSFKEVAAAVRATGRLATVWRVPADREEAELLLPLGL